MADHSGHLYPNIAADGYATLHLGDIHYHGSPLDQNKAEDELKSFGLCLGQAPQIEPDAFKGRTAELQQLQNWLLPTNRPHQQCIVSIVGLGGMGKTQLSLAHARECAHEYSSVFWVNAKDETSLRQELATLSLNVFHGSAGVPFRSVDEEMIAVKRLQRWLSKEGNDRWLLIFDNYDDPHLPGIRSATGYDIRHFFPTRAQGSILVTTRSTKLAFSKQLPLRRLEDVSTSLAILSQRSGRQLSAQNNDAVKLTMRLGGLPLALATAGNYLTSANISCGEYLELYTSMWMELFGHDAEELFEYEQRTLSSTWNISLNQVRDQNPDAAEFLEFLAFLSPHDLWYELIKADDCNDIPWMSRIVQSKIHFHQMMSQLHSYSLVDIVAGSYQVHPCLHDWLVERQGSTPNSVFFTIAVNCVANTVKDELDPEYWSCGRRLLEHIEQLESLRWLKLWQAFALNKSVIDAAQSIAGVEADFGWYAYAENMYKRVLAGKVKVLGAEHPSTFRTIDNLGTLYRNQGKLEAAENMYKQALAGEEMTLGVEHLSTLGVVNNLGKLYYNQDRLDKAEKMYNRALVGRESTLGSDHISTLETTHCLGALFYKQGKWDKTENMYQQALAGHEKALGTEHPLTLRVVNNLGNLYRDQGKLDKAEQMFNRARVGRESTLGPDHILTLDSIHCLSNLYHNQGKLDKAENMYQQVLAGHEKALGPEHFQTLLVVNNLGRLYSTQGELDKAEQMCNRALVGRESTLGPNHTATLDSIHFLGNLYIRQGKLDEAKDMYERSLMGFQRTLGQEHLRTLKILNSLGYLYHTQGKLNEAERFYEQALVGFERVFGQGHKRTLNIVNNLSLLYRRQGKLDKAEEVSRRAERR